MTMEQIKKDVVVVGGGPGGFAAAVTAARAGAQYSILYGSWTKRWKQETEQPAAAMTMWWSR